jgi:flagellar biosynthesis protein FlhB
MSEHAEKPFDATPRRIAKARREGNVARSAEFGANVSFGAAALTMAAIVPVLGTLAIGSLRDALAGQRPAWTNALVIVESLAPACAAASAGAAAAIVQNGGPIFVPIVPKLDRLDPMAGLRRILSRETLAHSARAALAFAAASAAMVPAIAWCAAALLRATHLDAMAGVSWKAAQEVAAAAAVVGSLFSIAEYGSARSVWLRKLRMSFDERKREAREEEGDAVARGRRRSMHRSLLHGAIARVKEAAFVVTNPTHVAVALAYEPPSVPVPQVLVRAAGETVRRVRELAERYRIPVVEDAALARALYRDGRSDAPIPRAHYVAVAAIVAALSRKDGIPR